MQQSFAQRRRLMIAGAGCLLAAPALTRAQSGGKVVRIVIGFPPGQATDIVARLMADRLHTLTGDNYIVDNRPGQGGSIALGVLAKSPADGSVMMLAHMSALATNPHMYKSVPYDTTKDFAPVGLVGDLPFVLVCHPSMPFSNVKELVAYAKANPDKLTHASSGNGTVSHLAMEEFKRKAGIQISHIPYKGSSLGLTDVMAGNVSMALETASGTQPFVQSGKLKALAVGVSKRLAGFPGVPTMAEEGFANFNASTWLMVIYPAGTSAATVQGMFTTVNSAMRTPAVEQRLIANGALPRSSTSPAEAAAYLQSEYKAWGDVVRRSGVSLD